VLSESRRRAHLFHTTPHRIVIILRARALIAFVSDLFIHRVGPTTIRPTLLLCGW